MTEKRNSRSDLIDINCELKHETEKAFLIYDGTKEVWIPKSQCEYEAETGNLTIPEWLAKDKGLI